MSDLAVVTEDLGGSPLSRALRAGTLPAWAVQTPRTPAEWRDRATTVAAEFRGAGWLSRLAPAFASNGPVPASLSRVAEQSGVVITTGQQPGLFGGPMLVLAKALTARALADALERATDVPTTAVFWAATDDADFDEASGVSIPTPDGAERLALTRRPETGTPMAAAPLDAAEVTRLLERFGVGAGSGAASSVVDAVRAAYSGGATVGSAFVSLLRAILEPLDIAVLDASHPAVLDAMRGTMTAALARASDAEAAVRGRSREIASAGFDPQVADVAGLSLVFANEGGMKRRIPLNEASRWAERAGALLTPTVLLRPIAERALLPTAAYVGGPAEVAYFAQSHAAAGALGLAAPLAVPRWSTTLIEPRIARVLASLGVEADALKNADALASRVARERLPQDVTRSLSAARQAVATAIGELRQSSAASLVPARSIDGAAHGVDARIDRLERRFTAAVKRRETELMRQITVARGALYPDGKRQERSHSFAAYLARYGSTVTDGMLAAAAVHARALVGSPAHAGADALIGSVSE
jgi:bacillithiol biosynthesis cysteine-adding enzyme BshC